MKTISLVALFVVAVLLVGHATAATEDLDNLSFEAGGHVLPVLVAVDDTGHVTKVDPAIKLQPGQQQKLENMIGNMIKGPAHDKDKKPKASQFVMMFSLKPAKDNPDQLTYVYASSKVVPLGQLHWQRTQNAGNNSRFTLVSSAIARQMKRVTAPRHPATEDPQYSPPANQK